IVVFLNNDTRVDKNWLMELVKVMESDEKIGICGSKMLMYSQPEFINSTGATMSLLSGYFWDRGVYEKDRGQYDAGGEVLAVCGGAMITKKMVFLELGGFQKEFFAYYEDVDVCINCWIHGYKVMYAPAAKVYHKLNASFKHISGEIPEKMERGRSEFVISLSERNRWYIYLTKFSLSALIIYLPIFLLYYFFASSWLLFLQLFLRKQYGYNYSRTFVHLKALWHNLKIFPKICGDRKIIQKNRKRNDWCFLRFANYRLIPARKTNEWRGVERNVGI
ncbi:MAG: glycosyltransferase family 2 protein, partial [Candidatus Heimdallarchaeota archaeon]|nr:glycosyltransferase family 2 protein [Candidatus Heimdallarchaeota archaeon]